MLGKRSYSRGNVALAALLLVTAVGFAAVTLDSVRVAQGSRAQVAASVTSPGTTQSPDGSTYKPSVAAVTGKCEIGFDYEIRETKGRPEISPIGATQCANTNDARTVHTDREGKTRYCSKDGWRCRYFYCKIDELRLKNSKGVTTDSECILMGVSAKPGETKDLTSERSSALSAAIKDVLANPDASVDQKKAAATFSQSLDRTVQAQILNAFNRETDVGEQTKILDGLQKAKNDAAALAGYCRSSDPTGASCGDLDKNSQAASAAYDAQKAKLEALSKQAQGLQSVKTVLEKAPFATVEPSPGACEKAGDPGCAGRKPPPSGCTFAGCGGGSEPGGGTKNPSASPSGSSGNLLSSLGQFLPMLAGLAGGYLGQNANQPSCTIQASPTSIAKAGQPVTLSWQTQNAQAAYLSNGGQVGPSGSITVYPQQTTTFSLQVVGYPPQQQQQANPYGTTGAQGQYVWNPQLGAYVYVQGQAQQQNPYVQLGQTVGQLVSGSSGGQQTAQCQTQVTVGATSGEGDKPVAQISCQPKIADVGMAVSISYACQNGATASKGEGFSTDNKLSGSASTTVSSPGSGSTTVSYGITCSKNGVTDSAQCTVNVNKPSIVLVANPKDIERGDTTIVGWVTGAMESCVISSPDDSEFTQEHKNNTSTSGSVRTPRLERDTKFVLTCTTKAGGTKTAETTVNVED